MTLNEVMQQLGSAIGSQSALLKMIAGRTGLLRDPSVQLALANAARASQLLQVALKALADMTLMGAAANHLAREIQGGTPEQKAEFISMFCQNLPIKIISAELAAFQSYAAEKTKES